MTKLLNTLPIAAILLTSQVIAQSPAQAETAVMTCMINNRSGNSPIGMRNSLTLKQLEDGTTVATYVNFPSNANGGDQRRVTLDTVRNLRFYKTSISTARQLLLSKPSLYENLLGMKSERGFKPVNDLLVCNPSSLSKAKTIAELPDGEYSYWSGSPASPNRVMSDDALLKAGGILFIFMKKGDTVTGSFSPIDNEAICVEGIAQGNKVIGMAYPYDGKGENRENGMFAWHPSGYLKVGMWETKPGKKPHYHMAELDLSAFNPVKLERKITPKPCV
jgi:hypothetical protein